MTKNDHFETQKCHIWAILASFKIPFSSLQRPSYNQFDNYFILIILGKEVAYPRVMRIQTILEMKITI